MIDIVFGYERMRVLGASPDRPLAPGLLDHPADVNGGVKTGHVAAQNQARGRMRSAMARALTKQLARAMALWPGGPILRRVIR